MKSTATYVVMAATGLFSLAHSSLTSAQAPGAVWHVETSRKITGGQGGFGGALANDDEFGRAVAALGDVDGDGLGDLAVGAWQDGAHNNGAVWILFSRADGTVSGQQKIGSGTGGFGGTLHTNDRFGVSVAGLGDLDGDGVPDLAVGARTDDDGGSNRGAVWILFLNRDGSVHAEQKLSSTEGGFSGALDDEDQFGCALAGPGDLDGDGVPDLVVGAHFDDDGGLDRGAVWLVLLHADGTMKAQSKISASAGGFSGALHDGDEFGSALAALGDFDGDGVADLAVGAQKDDELAPDAGALWFVFLNADGTVKGQTKFASPFDQSVFYFGAAVTALGDLDGNGVKDLVVGAPGSNSAAGMIALLFMESDGSVQRTVTIQSDCGWSELLDVSDQFGEGLTSPGDLDGDGRAELVVGTPGDDDGGGGAFDRGAVYTLFLEPQLIPPLREFQKISAREGGFTGPLENGDLFGLGACSLGDLDGDGSPDYAVGMPGRGAGTYRGGLWIVFSNPDRSVRDTREIGEGLSGFGGALYAYGYFGIGLAGLGDVDGDGVVDLAVGAPGDDESGYSRGAVWVLFLNRDGTVKSERKITDGQAGFTGALADVDLFGWSLANIGDVDHNGVADLAVGAPGDNDYDNDPVNCIVDPEDYFGAVWLLLLNPDGSVLASRKISAARGNLSFHLEPTDMFGFALTSLGDLDGNGMVDLAVGTPDTECHDFGTFGAVYVLLLKPDGSVRTTRLLTEGQSGIAGLEQYDGFGQSLAAVGDLDGDGVTELAAGIQSNDGGCHDVGATLIVYLKRDGTVKKMRRISATVGGFAGELADGDDFGRALAVMPDMDGDGASELLVGAPGDDDGGRERGALWWLDLGREPGDARPASSPPSFGGSVAAPFVAAPFVTMPFVSGHTRAPAPVFPGSWPGAPGLRARRMLLPGVLDAHEKPPRPRTR